MRLPSTPATAGIEGSLIAWPPPVQPLQVKGSKGSALGGSPEGSALWWGSRGKAPGLALFTRLPRRDSRGLWHSDGPSAITRANHQGVFMPLCFGAAARLSVAACVAVALASGVAWAQTAPAPTPSAADPVVAKVDGKPILLSDVKDAVQTLPPNAQSLPPQTLYPMLLDQMIDGRALVAEAQRTGLDKDPAVQRQVVAAEDQALETAYLHKTIGPLVTEAAVRARYDADIAGKPGVEEVHARHILVPDEATAKQIIAELGKGGDFAALSKQFSKDPGAAQQGGDLGWFKKDEMVPEFSDAAFALQPGQVDQTPVHTQFGWHVIQVLERPDRSAAELRAGQSGIAAEDDPAGRAGCGGARARPGAGGKIQPRRLAGARHRYRRAAAVEVVRALTSASRPWFCGGTFPSSPRKRGPRQRGSPLSRG